MACSCTCFKCGIKFDRYSGKLINISDSLMDKLRGRIQAEKHYVLCSNCIEEMLGREITLCDMKWHYARGNRQEFYSSNLLYLYRKSMENGIKILSNQRFIILTQKDYDEIVSLVKKCEQKGLIKGLDVEDLYRHDRVRDIRPFTYLLL